jgi:hypothetical protein
MQPDAASIAQSLKFWLTGGRRDGAIGRGSIEADAMRDVEEEDDGEDDAGRKLKEAASIALHPFACPRGFRFQVDGSSRIDSPVTALATGNRWSSVLAMVRMLALAFALMLTFLLSSLLLFVLAVDVRGNIAGRVLHVADDLLGFALDLLRGSFHLGIGVTGPLANLAFRPACCIVDCAFYPILIHDSTSVGFCFGLFRGPC